MNAANSKRFLGGGATILAALLGSAWLLGFGQGNAIPAEQGEPAPRKPPAQVLAVTNASRPFKSADAPVATADRAAKKGSRSPIVAGGRNRPRSGNPHPVQRQVTSPCG